MSWCYYLGTGPTSRLVHVVLWLVASECLARLFPKNPLKVEGNGLTIYSKTPCTIGGVLRVTRATGTTTETCARPSWLLRIESNFLAMGAKVGHPLQGLSLSGMHIFLVGLVLQDLLAPRRGERMAGSSSQTPNPFLV